ncbi:calcium-binding protein [Yoonia sediminilitoris]|uniref:Hemolysin type calcium-binding protein n=1 Tax=Yoonia sediminilitoris TaxID=1286148 RepID=A0A2T6K9Q0_9RHOB|nr:calcium-binding protein [Yoonia sediminilitoris]PUB11538.1 hemolysin type calcium-binding protein [Yoonia sediminilitoris]RCW91738.1 hemolysin type calcium-binding protein [Yoonia sediminilitoris]
MLAILGLMGIAVSAILFTGDVYDSTADTHDTAKPEEEGPDAEIVSMDQLLDEKLIEPDIKGDEAVEPGGVIVRDTNTDDDQTVHGTDESDRIITGSGDDYVNGKDGNDRINSNAGNDEIDGGRGDDTLDGGTGDDVLSGHVGDDALFGRAGDDTLNAGGGDDRLFGGEGNDALLGSTGDDLLIGGGGADTLHGGSGNDTLDGRGENIRDFLNGGADDDLLLAGENDHLHGGTGADSFGLAEGLNAIVADFDPTEDIVEITYEGPTPVLGTSQTDAGLVLHADGEVVATFTNLKELDLSDVILIAA